jgi:hypothetical protein
MTSNKLITFNPAKNKKFNPKSLTTDPCYLLYIYFLHILLTAIYLIRKITAVTIPG